MTLLRLVVLCFWSAVLVGCHTIDAVRRLGGSSPVTAVWVEPSGDRVRWLAEYREPPSGSDPILHRIFVRGVTKRGHLDIDPESTCVASFADDSTPAELLRSRQPLLNFGSHAPARDMPEARTSRVCETRIGLRLSGPVRYPEAQAIVVREQATVPAIEVPFPVEHPALDPRRWGWLLVAPAFDVGTIALSVPVAGAAIVFESLVVALGPFQIQDIGLPVLVLSTISEGGASKERVLGRAEVDGHIYVAANHWPRAWYHRALENPKVQVTFNGESADYLAVPVTGEELDRIAVEYAMPTVVRFLTLFPPRSFLRLDPR